MQREWSMCGFEGHATLQHHIPITHALTYVLPQNRVVFKQAFWLATRTADWLIKLMYAYWLSHMLFDALIGSLTDSIFLTCLHYYSPTEIYAKDVIKHILITMFHIHCDSNRLSTLGGNWFHNRKSDLPSHQSFNFLADI